MMLVWQDWETHDQFFESAYIEWFHNFLTGKKPPNEPVNLPTRSKKTRRQASQMKTNPHWTTKTLTTTMMNPRSPEEKTILSRVRGKANQTMTNMPTKWSYPPTSTMYGLNSSRTVNSFMIRMLNTHEACSPIHHHRPTRSRTRQKSTPSRNNAVNESQYVLGPHNPPTLR